VNIIFLVRVFIKIVGQRAEENTMQIEIISFVNVNVNTNVNIIRVTASEMFKLLSLCWMCTCMFVAVLVIEESAERIDEREFIKVIITKCLKWSYEMLPICFITCTMLCICCQRCLSVCLSVTICLLHQNGSPYYQNSLLSDIPNILVF